MHTIAMMIQETTGLCQMETPHLSAQARDTDEEGFHNARFLRRPLFRSSL